MPDILNELRANLAKEEDTLRQTALAVQQLRIAIAAIEQNAAESTSAVARQKRPRKNGLLVERIIDCVQRGIGTVAAMQTDLAGQGIIVKSGAISSGINRLQSKGKLVCSPEQAAWILRGDDSKRISPVVDDGAVNESGVQPPEFGG